MNGVSRKGRVREHFERVAPEYDGWKRRAWYYYRWLMRILGDEVPAGSRVLDVGCGTGALLDETGFDVVREDRRVLLPTWIPGLSGLVNERLSRVAALRRFCLVLVFVARPRMP